MQLSTLIAMLRQRMNSTILSLILNSLFWFTAFVVVTGGFDYQGSIWGHSVRLDATSPDLFVLLFLILLAVWHLLGRSLQELRCIRIWGVAYSRLRSLGVRGLLVVLSLLGGIFVVVPLARHFSFRTGYDLALFAQAYWNTLQGDFLFSSLKGGMAIWGDHFNPIVLGILPFYWLWPSPETLLVLQSLALVAGALPLYSLAKRELTDEGPAVFITLAYLAYLPLRQMNSFDFHPIAFATPLVLAAFYFMRKEAFGRFLLCCLLVGATKETGPIAVGLLGAACFFLSPKRWLGAVVALASVLWFFVNLAVVMPAFNPSGVATQLDRYAYLGNDPAEILRTLLTRPLYVLSENLSSRELFYPVRILGPVAFLPLLTPVGLLALPYLMINLLESSGVQVWLVHYQAELTAFVFIATVFGARRVVQARSGRHLAAVLTGGAFLFFGTSDLYQLREAMPTEDTRRIHAALDVLPTAGRVSAQAAIAPHLTQRKWLYFFPEVSEAEWVIVDHQLDPWPVDPHRFTRTVKRLKRVGFQPDFENGATQIFRQTGKAIPKRKRSR